MEEGFLSWMHPLLWQMTLEPNLRLSQDWIMTCPRLSPPLFPNFPLICQRCVFYRTNPQFVCTATLDFVKQDPRRWFAHPLIHFECIFCVGTVLGRCPSQPNNKPKHFIFIFSMTSTHHTSSLSAATAARVHGTGSNSRRSDWELGGVRHWAGHPDAGRVEGRVPFLQPPQAVLRVALRLSTPPCPDSPLMAICGLQTEGWGNNDVTSVILLSSVVAIWQQGEWTWTTIIFLFVDSASAVFLAILGVQKMALRVPKSKF